MARRELDAESNFELAVLGYDRQQVDRHVEELRQQVAAASAAFDLVIIMQQRLNEANQEIVRLREAPWRTPDGVSIGERITTILQAAEEAAQHLADDAGRPPDAGGASDHGGAGGREQTTGRPDDGNTRREDPKGRRHTVRTQRT